ncbi:MAG: hypothetical protein WCD20_16905 [Rhodomicrobium sp.]
MGDPFFHINWLEAGKSSNMRKKSMSFWGLLKSDLDRYRCVEGRSYLVAFVMAPGTLASASYRLGQLIWNLRGPAWLILPLKALHVFLDRAVQVVTGIAIAPTARIGPGLYIGHFSGIFVGADVEIGSNCDLHQGVTIGVSVHGDKLGTPRLGDRVYVAPGAKIFGRVVIGDDAIIGANSVVTASLQPRAVAIGIPGRVISYQGSFDYIKYHGVEADPERCTSLKMRSYKLASLRLDAASDSILT